MSRLDRARGVLDALDSGKPAPRPSRRSPTRAAPRTRQVLCERCDAQVTLAYLASGLRAPFDRAPDSGRFVLVDGVAVHRGPHHSPQAMRWARHSCGGRR